MVFYDASPAPITFKAITGKGYGAVGEWVAIMIEPVNGDRTQMLTPTLKAVMSIVDVSGDLQWQLATDAAFSNLIWTSSSTAISSGLHSKTVSTTLTDQVKYWARVRAGDGASDWGPWSSIEFTVDINAGRGYQTVYLNVGIDPTLLKSDKYHYVYLNQGVIGPSVSLDVQTMWENVRFDMSAPSGDVQFMYEGDVSTNTPTPHIWWLRPNSGRTGDGIEIICFGVGDLQNVYDGVVEIYRGVLLGWEPVPTISWQTYPETVNAYTEDRVIDEFTNYIDTQHQIVEITVPAGVVPPGHSLRIRTNGP